MADQGPVRGRGGRLRDWLTGLAILLLPLLALPFVWHALSLGALGLTRDLSGESRFFHPGAGLSNAAIFAHMALGGALTVLAPVQALPVLRRRWPRVHRRMGYVIAAAALVTATGGLVYIALQGTIGGPAMSAGFGLYGLLLGGAAVQTVRLSRARRFDAHRRWAIRLVVLALASWLYRVQYGLWYLATDGVWSNDAFTGGFDRFMFVGFYLPHLLVLEVIFRLQRPA